MAQFADGLDEEGSDNSRLRRRVRRIGGGAALVAIIAGGSLWLARKPIADSFIARELAARGMQGSYKVTRIGPRTQRLDDLVIGDPRRPDLTARYVEVDIGWGWGGARISRINANGVRVRGRLAEGGLSFGQLDRSGGGAGLAELPDWQLALEDARAEIATDYGTLVLAAEGRGPLRTGFAGTLGISASGLQSADCRLDRLVAPLDLASADGRLLVKGPVNAGSLLCTGQAFALAAPHLDLNLRGDLALEDVSGAISFHADAAEAGRRRFDRLSGLVTFKGKQSDLRGSASLSAMQAELDGATTDALRTGGNFALRPTGRDKALAWRGLVTADNLRPESDLDVRGAAKRLGGTPFAPLLDKLVAAIEQAGKANRLELGGAVNMLGSRGNATLERLALSSRSGLRWHTAEGTTARYSWPDGPVEAQGAFKLAGGGFPEGRVSFAGDGRGGVSGEARLAEYRAGSAALALAPVRFRLGKDGAGRIETSMTLDGPLPDGAVKGFSIPLNLHLSAGGRLALAGDCAPVRWQALRLATLSLEPAILPVCGFGNGDLRLADTRLRGRLGDSALTFASKGARYDVGSGRFELVQPELRLGGGESPVHLAGARLRGQTATDGMAGTIEAGFGRIGTVPLNLSAINGKWSFSGARLQLDGALRVSDAQTDARFKTLAGRDVRLTLADGRIRATGALVHPVREANVATVTIVHELGSGQGQADFVLDPLRFGSALQPDDLTPLALGVVANVQGVVEGQGQIRWTAERVSSDGRFETRDMSFAAAFGPVSGFSTRITFDDLLGMHTPPGQLMTVGSVNPGVDVRDGVIRYALLSSQQAVIEGGQWPFSGGTLELLPAKLDLDAQRPRNLTFRVLGLDAAAFVNMMQLDNIAATGTFDGLLPMIFDAQGGRIEGGLLVARQAGLGPLVQTSTSGMDLPCEPGRLAGRLSYVGEVSNAQLGTFGSLAFDALKNLRYRCLAIQLDGAIDGEFVTQVRVNGINQGTESARRSFLARPFLGLPFLFNVRIEAPFRGLFGVAADLVDPTQRVMEAVRAQSTNGQGEGEPSSVQPPARDKDIEGKRE